MFTNHVINPILSAQPLERLVDWHVVNDVAIRQVFEYGHNVVAKSVAVKVAALRAELRWVCRKRDVYKVRLVGCSRRRNLKCFVG